MFNHADEFVIFPPTYQYKVLNGDEKRPIKKALIHSYVITHFQIESKMRIKMKIFLLVLTFLTDVLPAQSVPVKPSITKKFKPPPESTTNRESYGRTMNLL